MTVWTSIFFEISWKVTRTRQSETNFATITSFLGSVHLSNKALHQSVHKKLLSYCKMNICHNYDYYLQKHLGVKTRGCVSVCLFGSSSYMRIGKPTTTVHFAVRSLKYSDLSPVQRLKGVWWRGGGVGPSAKFSR